MSAQLGAELNNAQAFKGSQILGNFLTELTPCMWMERV